MTRLFAPRDLLDALPPWKRTLVIDRGRLGELRGVERAEQPARSDDAERDEHQSVEPDRSVQASGRGGFGPYQIGYGAIVPKAKECDNLFVTFAISASHTAFSSIRMEPVLMCTSQSAATAAVLAIDAGVPVQKVDYEQLRKRLIADGQILEWKHAK